MDVMGEFWDKCEHKVTLNHDCLHCGDRVDSKLRLFTDSSTSRLISIEDLRDDRDWNTKERDFIIHALKLGYVVEKDNKEIILDISDKPASNRGSLILSDMVGTGHTLLNPKHELDLENSGVKINWDFDDDIIEIYQGADTYTVQYIKYGDNGKIIDYDTLKKKFK